MKRWTVLLAIAASSVLAVALYFRAGDGGGVPVTQSAFARDLNYSDDGKIFSTVAEAYPTSYGTTATTYHYGSVIDCSDAQGLTFYIKGGTGLGATTKTMVLIEWYPSDPRIGTNQWPSSPYSATAYTVGYALASGPAIRETLDIFTDATGAATSSTATVAFIVAAGNYSATTKVRAPFCRLCVYNAVADTDQGTMAAWVTKRYAAWSDSDGNPNDSAP